MQLLRKLTWPLSLLYGAIVYGRNLLYDKGYFKSNTFLTPTLCIGNLSVGGTGKTPMVEWVLNQLLNKKKVAVLSRGYKRKSKGFVLAQPSSSAEDIGDEPLQIYNKFPKATVAVDANRTNGIEKLEDICKPDLILLDDAYQHRRVQPTASVLLTSFGDLYTDDMYLPAGNLRDSKKAANRADLIIITKCPPLLDKSIKTSIREKLSPQNKQRVIFCKFLYSSEVKNEQKELKIESLLTKKVTVVTGIANPNPLLGYLASQNISFTHWPYPDHHFYSEKEITLFNMQELVLTTEKDFMRLKGKVKNLYYLEVQHQFLGDGATHFRRLLENLGN
ncbi:tetraacyldisaccharide 4'-kinase [Eudoraea chungangensis]|uniref:tetraacyldisaccharide 4'-kinase n=1 Tax=Eudoraea chungangensis TaxID=1481905 RepID=UPI0023EDFE23|nr:tetraacyldisaccharide 4'-kinase [Eudoraea chungangensis]